MKAISMGGGLLCALILAATASARDGDLIEGADLYRSQCMICHGNMTPETVGNSPVPLRMHAVRVAMDNGTANTVTDGSVRLIFPVREPANGAVTPAHGRIAFAPPFGPNLRGIVGRRAGTVEGFVYSQTFMKTLAGMEWSEAALDVWITNTQAWVPGVYMFYKQTDPEIRRKIIAYLKANP